MSDSYLNERSAKDWKKSHKHGAGEWLAERGTSLILLPLTLWAVWSGYQLAGQGVDAALAFAKTPLNAGLIAAIFVVSGWHMFMGLKVIVDDYIGKDGTRGFLNLLNLLFCLAVTGAALYALFLLVRS
ncbi:succinate dehydrogenase, hydrophobic membrane anchor protein [Asticcacaulis machinosus]|uniref:Succinate dehydrogenase hydrophobic membrane anchor subunit n=1 Tax=Asticcacaulis machinosus TaxID=2984211 RepID=A0ABT5HKZ8_9CAUL|nr:succinate dehydrogenase, hydrophobic membrane anchor protein [Asticcacaulis machinosus]MDC7676903.1 succinate dehydrogenase, hydrophobic membrane anchor protein [Asticcacaulis machinosus]